MANLESMLERVKRCRENKARGVVALHPEYTKTQARHAIEEWKMENEMWQQISQVAAQMAEEEPENWFLSRVADRMRSEASNLKPAKNFCAHIHNQKHESGARSDLPNTAFPARAKALGREMGQEKAPMTIYSMEALLSFVGKL